MLVLHQMGVRSRMVALISAAILPFLALIAAGIIFSYEEADRAARRSVALDAQLGAAKFSRVFLDAKVALGTLRGMPPLQAADRPRCDNFIQKVLANQPMFLTMGVINGHGEIVCHNKSEATGKFGDVDLTARLALPGSDDLLVGKFMIGPISKKPTVAVAMRLAAVAGQDELSIFGSLNLDVFSQLAQVIVADTDHTVALIEPASKRVLVRWPNIVPFGSAFPDHPLITTIAQHPQGGTTFTVGFDAAPRFFGFAPVVDAAGGSLAIALGLPDGEPFADVQSRSVTSIVLSLLAFAIAIALSATIAYWTQLKPLVSLVQKSERLGDGMFSAPVIIEPWQAKEFRGLAASLNETACKLMSAQEIEKRNIETERRFRIVADYTADMITAVDIAGMRTFVSGASREILGFEPEDLIGQDPLTVVVAEDHDRVINLFLKTKQSGDGGSEQYRVMRKDGSILWVEVSGRRMPDESGMVFTMRNISKRKAVEAELEAANAELLRLATTDELTGISNRREFNRVLDQEIRRARRNKNDLSVLLMDVDHFKMFNDTYGHLEGDRCLKEIARAISSSIRRPADACARYGGEEFAVILPDTGIEGARKLAEIIRSTVEELDVPHVGSDLGQVTISIGIATSRGDVDDIKILKVADVALYQAKEGGRNRVCSALTEGKFASRNTY